MMKNIEIEDMSTEFEVRILEKSDVDIVYDLSIKNSIFYQYQPPMVTKESINPQSYSFWNKNGFVTVEENQYIIMERIIM